MSGRHVMVDAICEKCGNTYQVRRTKFNAGLAKYCSKPCFYDAEHEQSKMSYGYENGKTYTDGDGGWMVRWYDEAGNPKTTMYPRWYWSIYISDIPDGFVINQIDRDRNNIDPSNFEMISRTELNNILARERVGKFHISEEHKKAVGDAQRGRKHSEEQNIKMSISSKRNWELGVHDSPETRKAMGVAHIGQHVKWSKESKEKLSVSLKLFYTNEENKQRHSEWINRGSEHGNWRDGASDIKYPPAFSKKLRKKIYLRDSGACRICGIFIVTLVSGVHHIDADKSNNEEDNLILLCDKCHGAVHGQYKTNDPVILAFRSQLYK